MSSRAEGAVTDLLIQWNEGDESVQDRLWPLIYGDLRRIAAELMNGERRGHTLQPTALVHEAFVRLVDQQRVQYLSRSHFFALAARMMRRVLVDHARARCALKRGGVREPALDATLLEAPLREVDVLDLEDALVRLEALDPEKARVVELKFFAGLRTAELADLLGCSERTVRRHWQVARLWLYRELSRRVER